AKSRRKMLFFIGRAMHPHYLEGAFPDGFDGLPSRRPAGQSDERNGPPVPRPLARKQHGILANRTEIGWQPIANVDESLLLRASDVNVLTVRQHRHVQYLRR